MALCAVLTVGHLPTSRLFKLFFHHCTAVHFIPLQYLNIFIWQTPIFSTPSTGSCRLNKFESAPECLALYYSPPPGCWRRVDRKVMTATQKRPTNRIFIFFFFLSKVTKTLADDMCSTPQCHTGALQPSPLATCSHFHKSHRWHG